MNECSNKSNILVLKYVKCSETINFTQNVEMMIFQT